MSGFLVRLAPTRYRGIFMRRRYSDQEFITSRIYAFGIRFEELLSWHFFLKFTSCVSACQPNPRDIYIHKCVSDRLEESRACPDSVPRSAFLFHILFLGLVLLPQAPWSLTAFQRGAGLGIRFGVAVPSLPYRGAYVMAL